MIEALKKKQAEAKGFTLVELLIVVAIIAILIAISIPLVTKNLDEARINTDAANVRSAKAVATVMVLENGTTANGDYVYDAASGTLKKFTANDNAVKGYGQYGDEKDDVLYVKIAGEAVTWGWDTPALATFPTNDKLGNVVKVEPKAPAAG